MEKTLNAKRLDLWRARQKRRAAVVVIEVEPAKILAAAQARGIVGSGETIDRTDLAALAGLAVADWVESTERSTCN